jgi:hypothetical protein
MRIERLRRMQRHNKPEQVLSFVAKSIHIFLRDNRDYAYSFDELKAEFKFEDIDDNLLRSAIGLLLTRGNAKIRYDGRVEYVHH